MTFDPSALDLLSGGAPSLKFPNLGDSYTGTVVGVEKMQQRDFDTDEPAFWSDGNPKMQLVITLSTDEREVGNPTDDGDRRLFVKGKMLGAIKAALAGQQLALGGTLTIKYAADGPKTNPKFNPPKLYEATYAPPPVGYVPPSATVASADVDEDPF